MIMLRSTHKKLISYTVTLLEQAGRTIEILESQVKYLKDDLKELNRKKLELSAPQFTKEEIRSLLMLVHPDRHDGKESAVRMTQKLLAMRE
jgi:hypothetical protein